MSIQDIFSDSYFRVLDASVDGQGFFDRFYARFTGSSPEVQEKFKHTNMNLQKAILRHSFYHLLDFFVSRSPSDYLSHVARLHGRKHYDIPPGLYDLWLEAMLETVREFDPHCCAEVEHAWCAILSEGIDYMKRSYE